LGIMSDRIRPVCWRTSGVIGAALAKGPGSYGSPPCVKFRDGRGWRAGWCEWQSPEPVEVQLVMILYGLRFTILVWLPRAGAAAGPGLSLGLRAGPVEARGSRARAEPGAVATGSTGVAVATAVGGP
jgi:hypothetical protein